MLLLIEHVVAILADHLLVNASPTLITFNRARNPPSVMPSEAAHSRNVRRSPRYSNPHRPQLDVWPLRRCPNLTSTSRPHEHRQRK
jgi:hypothetical protein